MSNNMDPLKQLLTDIDAYIRILAISAQILKKD